LESALSTFQASATTTATEVSVTWKPYMIDRGTDINGEEFEAYNVRRWGGSGWTHELKEVGAKEGATFSNWKWWPNTLKAHQLIKFANERCGVDTSKSNAVLFNALYEQGKNVSLLDTLVQIGKNDLNLPEQDLREYLDNDQGAEDVLQEIRQCQRIYRTQSVPTFIIEKEGRENAQPLLLSGAQPSRKFLEIFRRLA